ncbi:unnamed protein product [Calicophoron daubneyi]|uniref:Uncharacterized protein n=1 Tax=Calicophoron daubneyi TaxID=300641 RepID=A0AAV2T6T2_CALDB
MGCCYNKPVDESEDDLVDDDDSLVRQEQLANEKTTCPQILLRHEEEDDDQFWRRSQGINFDPFRGPSGEDAADEKSAHSHNGKIGENTSRHIPTVTTPI